MRKKSLLAVAVCTAALAGASASAAFAGEVQGPPGTPSTEDPPTPIPPDLTRTTAVREHANSICAFSGLNDLIVGQGPVDFIAQSPGQDVRNGGPPGIPGVACGPGSNEDRGTPPFK
jgi:hypothetical protein